jgi:hypothetical protein
MFQRGGTVLQIFLVTYMVLWVVKFPDRDSIPRTNSHRTTRIERRRQAWKACPGEPRNRAPTASYIYT